jgi:divalent metal cation (Fe/Co/Zn/Cd) transporter
MDRIVISSEEIQRVTLSVPGVLSTHRIRNRGYEGAIYVDLHIQVDPLISAAQAHTIAHQVQNRLREHFPQIQDVTIHVEPAGASADVQNGDMIIAQLRRLSNDLGMRIHDMWAYEIDDRYDVECHLEVDGGISLHEAHQISSAMTTRAKKEIPHLSELTIHIEPQGQLVQPLEPGLAEEEVARQVRRIANDFLGTEDGCHQVQVYRQSNQKWATSMHCQLPGETSVSAAHRTSTLLEAELRARIPELERAVIHAHPSDQ